MRRLLLSALAALSLTFSYSQTVSIKRVELVADKIIVTYDLEDSNPNNAFWLNLYSSKDNFAVDLKRVSGDVGMDIKPGAGKKIIWAIVEEYGGYKGKLSLEIRGKVYTPFVRLQNFDTKKSYKRGKSYEVTWKSGSANPINIELYKGGQRVGGDVNHPNNGSYTLFIPEHAKPGKDYKLKISDTRNTDEVIYTNLFKVSPKIPLWMKVLPVAAVGAVVAILASGGKKAPKDDGNTETDIADPKFPD